MAQTYKVLGQLCPANTDLGTLYTVPASTRAVVSTINVANISASAITYRIAIRPGGETIEAKHYQAYDVALLANDSIAFTLGVTLAATDVVSVRSSSANNVAFSIFGMEETV
jgi:hypothetical protein